MSKFPVIPHWYPPRNGPGNVSTIAWGISSWQDETFEIRVLYNLCWRKFQLWMKFSCRGPGCPTASDKILPMQSNHLAAQLGHSGRKKDTCRGHARFSTVLLESTNSTGSFRMLAAFYPFQYVIFHSGSASSLQSFTLSLWDSATLILLHTYAEHSPVWHSTIRKSPSLFFNRCSCVTNAKAIHANNVDAVTELDRFRYIHTRATCNNSLT